MTFRAVCALKQNVILRFGSGLFFTAASGKKPCLAHCRSFRRSLPKRKIFAVWTDLETWPWLSRCASLAMPANGEGKLIAYKWRKSAILETPEQNFFPGRNSRCTFSQTPLTPTWEKSGKLTPPPEIFSARESSSNVQNRAFWKPLSKNFFQIASHEYQQPSITPANHVSVTSCQRPHIARCPSM